MSSDRNFAVDLATQAGTLLKERFQPTGTPATLKFDHSFVTEADLAADHLITQAIHQYAPAELILSEEMHTGVGLLEPAVWIVDPLDGTTNYSLGMHVWGVSIARLVGGEPVLGVLYFPLTGELYVAEKGLGAYCNERCIHVEMPDPSKPWPFFACCSRTHRRYSVSVPYKPRIYGSAAYSFCMLARGAACVAFEATPKIWDLAAVWLLVGEAGGSLAQLKGEPPFPLFPNRDYAKVSYPTLAAASSNLLETSLGQITAKS